MYGELTSGARDLYTFLCRCRNQTTGKCCPSVSTTQDALNLSRARVFALRKELTDKGWAEFDGNYAVRLFGFDSLKNKTICELAKEDSGRDVESLKNKTPEAIESQKQDSLSLEIETDNDEIDRVIEFSTGSLENKTESPDSLKNKTESLKNKTEESQKQDSHIRKNQQREPAKRTNGANAPPIAQQPEQPDASSTIWQLGVALLRSGGEADKPARSFLGKMASEYGKEKLAQAIISTMAASPISPKEYLVKVLQGTAKGSNGGNSYDQERARRARRYLDRRDRLAAEHRPKRPQR